MKALWHITALAVAVFLALSVCGCNVTANEPAVRADAPNIDVQKEGYELTDVSGQKNSSGAYSEMEDAEFWLGRVENPSNTLMTSDEIDRMNEAIYSCVDADTVDMYLYDTELSREELTALLSEYPIPTGTRYIGDIEADADYYDRLLSNEALDAISDINKASYGTVVRECELRTFPTDDPSYESPNDVEFDLFLETTLKVFEKAIVFHTSNDGEWYFTRTESYMGWVKRDNIALTDKETWRELDSRDFIVITGNAIVLEERAADERLFGLRLSMGTRLPLADEDDGTGLSYYALLPVMDGDGQLSCAAAGLPRSSDISQGYLPYTVENVLLQAFKLYGERYGWGGSFDARDCSALIRDVYLTMGLAMPRNGSSQLAIPANAIALSDMAALQKKSAICELTPGALLGMPGHIMLYVGEYDGEPYVIHAAYAYGASGLEGAEGRMKVNSVVVSDLNITRANGSAFIDNITEALEILPAK